MNYVPELLKELWLFIQQPINIFYTLLFITACIVAWHKFNERIKKSLEAVQERDKTLSIFITSTARYIFILIILLIALAFFGVDTKIILGALGTIVIAIGLSLKDTMSNVANGILMLSRKPRPFNIDDYVTVAGQTGTVVSIKTLKTELRTSENFHTIIPNSEIWNNEIINHTKYPVRRADEKIRLALSADIEKTQEIIVSILNTEKGIKHLLPHICFVESIADGVVTLNIRFWTEIEDFIDCRSKVLLEIKRKLLKMEIEFAPPAIKLTP